MKKIIRIEMLHQYKIIIKKNSQQCRLQMKFLQYFFISSTEASHHRGHVAGSENKTTINVGKYFDQLRSHINR